MGLWGIDMQVPAKMIKAALEAWFGEPVNEPYDEHVDNMRFAIQAAIQAAWVSVDDKLPPLRTEVLVKTGAGRITTDVLTKYDDGSFGFEFYVCDGLFERIVTHWMPLPEFKEHS
jgi:hypothetical protein